MAEQPMGKGLLRVVTPEENQTESEAYSEQEQDFTVAMFKRQLVAFVNRQFTDAKNFRESEGIEQELLLSLRTYRGQYDAQKLQQIEQFRGSKVYSRITASKCRGATAILRDIYLNSERPWSLQPTPVPELPEDIMSSIMQLVQTETATLQQAGQPIDEGAMKLRVEALMESAQKAAQRNAARETREAASFMEDLLIEGGFYKALNEMIADLPVYLYGIIKGPVVRKQTQIKWAGGQPTLAETVKLCWNRVSPFDIWFSPAASTVNNASVFERVPLARDELADLRGLPGYDDEAIEKVLMEYDNKSTSWARWSSSFETTRAELERRETLPEDGEQRYLDTLEFHGYVRGQWLADWGVPEDELGDLAAEYYVTCWLICDEIIKVQVNPNPRQRPIYYVTSFEKIPGSLYGNGLPQILSDIQDVANATLRALVNNLSIASGPQVIVDDDRMAPGADKDMLYPWKRWHVTTDPYSNNQAPIQFYQPNSNAQELLGVYKEFSNMADEISAIPRYMTGSTRAGGAATTASGLAMLMNNSSKVMQSVVANIDQDIMQPVIDELYDMVMLLHPDKLRGDEQVVVKGVANALRREQDRVRQLEFLQITANPIDAPIIGPERRANLLRAVSKDIGLPYENVVPEEEEVKAALANQPPAGGAPPAGAPQGNAPPPAPSEGGPPHMNTQSNARQTTGQ